MWRRVGATQLALKVVVVRVLSHAPVEEGPCEVVDSILLVFDGSSHHLSTKVVVKEVVKVGLSSTVGGGGEGGMRREEGET